MATCLDATGLEYPNTYRGGSITPLEGRSLLPAFVGKQARIHDAIFWEHEGNQAVREDNWKLVSKHPGGWELYDLAADRTEMNNLAASDPDRVKRMAAKYQSWAARCGVLPWNEVQPMRKKV
jgi:arylsulfatase